MTAAWLFAGLQDRNQPVRYWRAQGFTAWVWRGRNGATYAGFERTGYIVVYRGCDVVW
jgi:hypothetical protein